MDEQVKQLMELLDQMRDCKVPLLFAHIKEENEIDEDETHYHVSSAFGGTYDAAIAMLLVLVQQIHKTTETPFIQILLDVITLAGGSSEDDDSSKKKKEMGQMGLTILKGGKNDTSDD